MNLAKVFSAVFGLMPFIPLYIYGKRGYNFMEKEIKIYWWFLMFAFVFQIGLSLAARLNIVNTFFIVLFQLIEYAVLSLLFYMWNPNKLLRVLIPLFLLGNIISFIYFFAGNTINYSVTIDKYLRNFVLIPLAFYTAYKFAISSENELLTDCKFWILSGILINTALSAFVFVVRSYSISNREVSQLAENMLLIVNLITYIIFIKGFLCLKTNTKYSGS